MILISHRGNIDGPDKLRENDPLYVVEALKQGYDVEVDIWYVQDRFMFGHDEPKYEIDDYEMFIIWGRRIWFHCKNIEALNTLKRQYGYLNYFWHEEDTVTLTSQNYIWAYPGNQPIQNSIAVMPEIYNDDLNICKGICSDYIINYKK